MTAAGHQKYVQIKCIFTPDMAFEYYVIQKHIEF